MYSMVGSLPSETLLSIFCHLDDSPSSLSSAALVCRGWAQPAQAVLHHHLAINSPAHLTSWLECNTKQEANFYCRELQLKVTATKAVDARKLLSRVRGVRQLELNVDRARFGSDLLQQDNLERLTSLTLATSFVAPTHQRPLRLPFELESLSLSGMYSSYPPALITALGCASPRLRALSLSLYGGVPPTFFSSLARSFTTLTSLHVHGTPPLALLPLLSQCENLQTFTCWDAPPELLRALPDSVQTIEFTKDYIRPSGTELTYLELAQQSSLFDRKELKSLKWKKISKATLKNQRGGNDLLDECKGRRVTTEFGVQAVGKFGIPGAAFNKRWVPGFPGAE